MIDPESPVSLAEEYVGQRSTVRRIFSRIGAERPQSVAVIGGRKVGKTSLFNFLLSPQARMENLGSATDYVMHGFSADGEAACGVELFLARINDLLASGGGGDESPYTRLQRRVEEMHRSGKKLVFFFDDFHKITSNKKFPLEFFSFLRSLANNYNLAYVTSSFLELQKLCVAKDIEESPFFNIFTNISLGLLSGPEAVYMLVKLSGWDEKKAGEVVDWCGPSPYLVKVIAKHCQTGGKPDGDYEKQFLPLFQDYFARILAVVPAGAFKALKDLAKGRQPDVSEAHLLRPLVRHRFLDEEDEKLSFFSEAFKVFTGKNLKQDMLGGGKNALH